MNNFQLQPGDYIRTSDVPKDKRQAVIDAFVADGASRSMILPDNEENSGWDYEFIGWWVHQHDKSSIITASSKENMKGFMREVNLDQIIGKPMLIEALKPGMRAMIDDPHGTEHLMVENRNNAIMVMDDNNPNRYVSNISYLTTTDYEIISADPVPWMCSEGETYHYIDAWGIVCFDILSAGRRAKMAFRTSQGAEKAAKIMKVINAICNMQGYGGDGAISAWTGSDYKAYKVQNKDYQPDLFDFGFDTLENAKAAANHANKLIDEMQ